MQRDLDFLQARDTPSTSDWGINSGIDNDGPQYDSSHHEQTNEDGTSSSSSNINANIPDGPHLNIHDNHQTHHHSVPPPPSTPIVIPTPTSSVPIVTPIVTPTPTPVSPPPPPPVVSSPAPEPEEPEEIGECVAPGTEDEPVETDAGDCPCEDRFGTVEAKLDSLARQLDELKALQAQLLHK